MSQCVYSELRDHRVLVSLLRYVSLPDRVAKLIVPSCCLERTSLEVVVFLQKYWAIILCLKFTIECHNTLAIENEKYLCAITGISKPVESI